MMHSVSDRISEVIREYNMIPENGIVIAAVSGGADSMTMLHYLTGILPKERILVCHVNHGIRGAEADRDEEFVRGFCKDHQLSFELLKTNIPELAKARGECEEECGRKERYRFFSSFLNGPDDRIATAHTLTDSVETVLFHIISGTSVRGLSGIPAVRGQIIRPLLGITRSDTELYCSEHGIGYMTDSTNSSLSHPRNFIRSEIIPRLETVNPAAQMKIAALSGSASVDETFLSELALEKLKSARRTDGYDSAFCLSLPQAILLRILRILAEENGAERVTYQQLESARSILGKNGIAEFTGNTVMISGQGRFSFIRKSDLSVQETFSVSFVPDGEISFPGGVIETEVQNYTKNFNNIAQKINNLLFTGAIDYDIITQDLVVRTRLPGDYFVSSGNSVRKSLRRFLSEKRVPREMRDRLVLIAKGNEVLFLEGFGACERARIKDNTLKAVFIKIKRGNESC